MPDWHDVALAPNRPAAQAGSYGRDRSDFRLGVFVKVDVRAAHLLTLADDAGVEAPDL
jgi:hypothetical protein